MEFPSLAYTRERFLRMCVAFRLNRKLSESCGYKPTHGGYPTKLPVIHSNEN
jgi:hypothetical protein